MEPSKALRPALPVDDHIPKILSRLSRHRALVLAAPPGAGKTTRLGPALAAVGPAILLQPRRVAARAIARRIAAEQGWRLGQEVGWQIRFERHFTPQTRLLVATEGILTARLQADPLLSGFKSVILDEFHERSLHADVALALARQAWLARDDLWLVVMSATMDAAPVSAYLGGCPAYEIHSRTHPVETEYWPGVPVPEAACRALEGSRGHLLCFLPGAREIAQAQQQLSKEQLPPGTMVLPLHGALSAGAQEAALKTVSGRKIILATNLAETSLTIDGVETVIDSGYHKILKYDVARGIDRLELERIPEDSARQRAGRAGRTAPGRAIRLWERARQLEPHQQPEIMRVDLAAPSLDILAWGTDPRRLEWFEPPPDDRLSAALQLLEQLGAMAHGRLTRLGELLGRFPLHPRLAKVTVEAGGGVQAAACCALLSERPLPASGECATVSDILLQADRIGSAPPHLQAAAREIAALARRVLGCRVVAGGSEETLLRALWAGFPDRLAQRRAPGSDRFLLASGHGARQAQESGVREGEFVVALALTGANNSAESEAIIRQASLVRKEWLKETSVEIIHHYDEASQSVKAMECRKYQAIVLSQQVAPPDAEAAFPLLMEVLSQQDGDEPSRQLLRRAERAGIEVDMEEVRRRACQGQLRLPRLQLRDYLDSAVLRGIDRVCPETIPIPSGRRARLDYGDDGAVRLRVKLQELFGFAETPRIGRNREAVIIELLAPNGRPVQTTTDLASFWKNTYPQVRKELRGRYPKHPWPEDPHSAQPAARTKRRES